MKNSLTLFLFLLLALGNFHTAFSQCINSFPYNEDFETSDGNWVKSSNVHWRWGQITTKPVIKQAASGQNCWIAGDLFGSNYAFGISYLESPCFDFSGMTNPEIGFMIFWETEKSYDGVNFQYSIDNGINWTILGDVYTAPNCIAENWYNYSSLLKLNGDRGWSGSVAGACGVGDGSGKWVFAKHSIGMLAGKSNVRFRFSFGAGNICNDYDGFGLDDIVIREASPYSAEFNYICQGNNKVDFAPVASTCITSVKWDFGDPATGADNTASSINASHVFSNAGTFKVTLNATFANGSSSVFNKSVTILDATPVITNPIKCFGESNGSVKVNVIGGSGNYTFNWNTTPPQITSSISNLSANTYTVNVTSADACPVSSSVTLVEPNAIVINTTVNAETCNSKNGSIDVKATGGSGSFTYLWSNNESSAFINKLSAGSYSVKVSDAHGCSAQKNGIIVENQLIPAIPFLGNDTVICPRQTLLLNPGSFISYRWQNNSTKPTFSVSQTGKYSVEVVNNAGCKGSGQIQVTVDCREIFFPVSFTPNGDGINDRFGAVGNVAGARNFNLMIYNRWGQKVFESQNPFQKWDGAFKGLKGNTESFVWLVTYRIAGGPLQNKKGSVILIR